MGDVAYGIFGLLLLGLFGWAIVGILRRAANALRGPGTLSGLVAQLRHGAPGQRRAQAERRLRATEERLVGRLGFVAPSRSALLADDEFVEAVDALEQLRLPTDDLIAIGLDEKRPWASRIAVATLARLEQTPAAWAPTAIRRLTGSDWDYGGLLLLSLERSPGEVLGPALSKIDEVLADDLAGIAPRADGGRAGAARRRASAQERPSLPRGARRGAARGARPRAPRQRPLGPRRLAG